MIRTYFLTTLFFILFWDVSPASARNCYGDAIPQPELNSTVTFNYTARRNRVCTRTSNPGRDTQFLGMEILDYPREIIKIVSNPYSLAFSANKTGQYEIRYRLLVNVRGRVGYFNRVMKLKVVRGSF
jgi:hypothetical protein